MLRLYVGDKPPGLHQMARDGAYEAIVKALQKGKNIGKKDKEGCTPLHIAAQAGRIEILRLLMDKGADVEAEDEAGLTPLHYASMYGQVEVVQVLLRQGANVLKEDKEGRKASGVICHGIPDRRRRHTISGLLSLAEMKAEQERQPSQKDCQFLHSLLERRLCLCSTPSTTPLLSTDAGSTTSEASGSTGCASRCQTQHTESDSQEDAMVDIYTGSRFLNNDVRHSASHLRLKEPMPGKHNMDIPYVNIFGD
ncbi:unnamed protein product [Ostreobium quekettii]|uniref:Uncharacterized protein n=1 Tax=Ostreobium quekettii TaxID=121088 RepID=A0A8S1J357_9CHLO|nr:unnamed protein product [Ostreobium quekettii]|eukprot:evm.model.scf_619EXC.2 EVM.evm.TU.scf_619EXC.2   scf_619EXC:17572-19951(+)